MLLSSLLIPYRYAWTVLSDTIDTVHDLRHNDMDNEKCLVVIAHAPSENTQRMLEAILKGANNDEVNVNVRYISPLETRPEDIKTAQAIIIGTTENLANRSR